MEFFSELITHLQGTQSGGKKYNTFMTFGKLINHNESINKPQIIKN